MRKFMILAASAAALAMTVAAAPASAQVASARTAGVASPTAAPAGIVNVRWRGHRWHRGWRGRGYYGGYYHDNSGAAVAAGIAGLVIGGALAAQAQSQGNSVAYCEQRFRSYDPASGTYLGYDGYRHPCP